MKVVAADQLPDVRIIEPEIHRDHRGHFLETYRAERYRRDLGIDCSFAQDNLVRSRPGVLRGLHYQHPNAQGKLVQVIRGANYDAVVDIRRGSPTFGEWFGVHLSADRLRQLWIPPGFAHGYLSLADPTEVYYKCTEIYHPDCQHTLQWNDPEVGVEWPTEESGVEDPVLSEKDASGSTLEQLLATNALPFHAD